MLRDFLSFVAALWHEWKVLLTGGSIIALSQLWQYFGGRPLPRHMNWLIVGLTMILAAFLAWRKQWMEADDKLISLCPTDLMRLIRSRTFLHAEKATKPYLGKKIRVTGTFDNAFSVTIATMVWLEYDQIRISFLLPIWRLRDFAPFPRGEPISVVGRIGSIDGGGISLRSVVIVPTPLEVPQSPTHDQQGPPPLPE